MSESIPPRENDVLMGRGGANHGHEGNERLRRLARGRAREYQGAAKKRKGAIAREILQYVRGLEPAGRFLQKNENTNTWETVTETVACEKVRQCLRDAKVKDGEYVESAPSSPSPNAALSLEPPAAGPGSVNSETNNRLFKRLKMDAESNSLPSESLYPEPSFTPAAKHNAKKQASEKCKNHGSSTSNMDISPLRISNFPFIKRLGTRDLKPRLRASDDVFVAWRSDAKSRSTNSGAVWCPGRINAAKKVECPGNKYGPTRYYDVQCDNGEELNRVEALRAYDFGIVRRKGSATKASDLNLPKETFASSFSNLKGCSFRKDKSAWRAAIGHKGFDYHMGYYSLKSDAAFAYDEALRLLKEKSVLVPNFATEKQYTDLRAVELRRTGLSIDYKNIQEKISSHLDRLVTNYRTREDDFDGESGKEEEMTKKCNMNSAAAGEVNKVETEGQDTGFVAKHSDLNLPDEETSSSHEGEHAPPDDRGPDHCSHDTVCSKGPEMEPSGLGLSEEWNFSSLLSNLKGCNFSKAHLVYHASIGHRGKRFHLGFYKLKCDAAFAYDEALRRLKETSLHVDGKSTPNFVTEKQYTDLRAVELRRTQFSVNFEETQKIISSFLVSLVTRCRAHEVDLHGETQRDREMMKKGNMDSAAASEVTTEAEAEGQDAGSMTMPSVLNLLDYRTSSSHEGERAPPQNRGPDHCTLDTACRKEPTTKPSDLNLPKEKTFASSFSNLKGFSFKKNTSEYTATISHKGIGYYMGSYRLKSDAAFAYDKALRLLKDESVKVNGKLPTPNFVSDKQYIDLRTLELKMTQFSVEDPSVNLKETQARISSFLDHLVENYYIHEVNLCGERRHDKEMMKKGSMNSSAAIEVNTEAEAEAEGQDAGVMVKPSDLNLPEERASSSHQGEHASPDNWGSDHRTLDASLPALKGCTRSFDNEGVRAQSRKPNFATEQQYKDLRAMELRKPDLSVNFEDTQTQKSTLLKTEKVCTTEGDLDGARGCDVETEKKKTMISATVREGKATEPEVCDAAPMMHIRRKKKSVDDAPRQKAEAEGQDAPSDLNLPEERASSSHEGEHASPDNKNVIPSLTDKSYVIGTGLTLSLETEKSSEETFRPKCNIRQPLDATKKSENSPIVSIKALGSLANSPTSSTAKTKNTTDFIEFNDDQVRQMNLPFSKGSAVWFNFGEINNSSGRKKNCNKQGQSFRTGVVAAVCLHHSAKDILYQIKHVGVDRTEMLPQEKLCYAPSTAVSIIMPSGINLPGEVLLCSEVAPCVFSYTIIILKGANIIQVEENVLSHRIARRKAVHS